MSFVEKLFTSELERTRDLVQSPDWYMEYGWTQKIRAVGFGAIHAMMSGTIMDARKDVTQQRLAIFEQLLTEGVVRIGDPLIDELDDHDEHRKPIDQIMIHHSDRPEGLTLSQLNAMHFLRLYVPRYQKGDIKTHDGTLQPIYSHHFDDQGTQVFYGYHWKVEQDGTYKRLLPDEALTWHAGEWETNMRSVAIVIDDDLTDKDPSEDSLEAVATIISEHYQNVNISAETLIGHRATAHTVCPGNTFDTHWKQELLAKL